MPKCALCGPISHNPADFAVSYGLLDQLLQVCRYCLEDLQLLGFRCNQVVRLPRVRIPAMPLTEVLGPVYSFVAGWKVSGATRFTDASVSNNLDSFCGSASPIHESATAEMMEVFA